MFIAALAKQSDAIGVITRSLMPTLDHARRMCLSRTLGEHPMNALAIEIAVVSAANGYLAKHRYPFRVMAFAPYAKKQHHAMLTWARLGSTWDVASPTLINLYPPSRRKPADDESDSDARDDATADEKLSARAAS